MKPVTGNKNETAGNIAGVPVRCIVNWIHILLFVLFSFALRPYHTAGIQTTTANYDQQKLSISSNFLIPHFRSVVPTFLLSWGNFQYGVAQSEWKIKTCCHNFNFISLLIHDIKNRNKKRKMWTREWLLKRKGQGCYENLMCKLAVEDQESYWI